MALALQPTLATASCFYNDNITCPILPLSLKIKGNPRFSSSSSLQALRLPNSTSTYQEIVRPLGNFPPDMWGDRFLTLPFTYSEFESYSRQVKVFKGMVNDILLTSTNDPIENILVINSLCRLGVSYHFESEIEKQLNNLFIILPQLMENKECNLYTVAIIFQVFRSHGYQISCDVFNKFKNIGNGTFKEEVGSDIKGMISLYEASHWRMDGEVILDEALSFTRVQLESIANQLSSTSNLVDYIVHALQWPHHRSMPRVDARHYISFYENNEESRNDVLLKFAKYDFNWVQMLLQQELSLLSSWWRKSSIASRFPYVRHRIVEFYFMAVAVFFEPRFARGRNIFAKWYAAFGLIDDTYDAYGIYEELQYFTKAMERFDISAIDELPIEYMKPLYEAVLNICNKSVEEVSKEGRYYSVSYTKEELKKLVLSYDVQARWTHECLELPTFDEYLDNGKWSIAVILSLSLAMIGMEEADEKAYKWLKNPHSKILEAATILCRLYDDIQTNEEEEKRGGQVSGIACYMRQYRVSRKEAIEAFKERIEVAWKQLNEGFMRPSPVSPQILMRVLHLVRLADITYKTDDGLTNPEISYKHHVAKVLIDPIPIED